MLRALGKKLILRPVPAPAMSGGIHLPQTADPVYDHKYYVISCGPQVPFWSDLRHGGVVVVQQGSGQSFEYEGHPLRVIDRDDVLMVLP